MRNGSTKTSLFVLGLGLIAGGSIPAAFAQQNDPGAAASQTNLTAPLNNLNDAQKTYAAVKGMVSEMPLSGLAPRQKAAQALEQIRSGVLQLRGTAPNEGVQSALLLIGEAQTALKTDSAQTIAWSLQTVSQEVQALQGNQPGQNSAQSAAKERPGGGTQAPEQTSTAKAPEQQQARVAVAEQRTGVTPRQEQAPNSNVTARVTEAGQQTTPPEEAAKAQKPEQTVPPPATGRNQSGGTASAGQQGGAQNALASMKREDVVGKKLYDKSGSEVASIQDVKMSDGKISAVEVDVGGFLGIGSRRVSVPASTLEVKGDRIESTAMTADQIRNLPHETK